ncbi:MAG: hypothetical protein ACYTKD_16145 [Planctomycetota bacterium]|jgi:hypothetical protein
MADGRHDEARHPFPDTRPEITIAEVGGPAFEVDCRELSGWFLVPEPGARARWAIYDQPEWRLSEVTEMRVVGPAEVDDVSGVEIDVRDWTREGGGAPMVATMYARLTETRVEWLAVLKRSDEGVDLQTFHDEDFEDDWGGTDRRIADAGRLFREGDGAFRREPGAPEDLVAGVCRVAVGGREFRCLRVLYMQPDPDEEHAIMSEAFLTEEGRTVLRRRYNSSRWARRDGKPVAFGTKPTWEEELPGAERVSVDGVVFVHWYDCVGEVALGP